MVAVDQAHAQRQIADRVGHSVDLLGSSLAALNERGELFLEIVNRIQFVVDRLEDGDLSNA
jgi:hypothetical protein